MIVLATFALMFLGVPSPASDLPRARLEVEPSSTEVGEPMVWSLVIRHDAGISPRVEELQLDDSWVVFDRSAPVAFPDPEDPDPEKKGRRVTRATWTVASLEPGDRKIPAVAVHYDLDGALRSIQLEGKRVRVAGLLAEDEVGPRPLVGFRDVEGLPEPLSPLPGVLLVAGLLVAALGWIARRFVRRRPVPPPVRDVRAELAALDEGELRGHEAIRDAHYSMTRLIREEADRRRNDPRDGLTDEEWLGQAREWIASSVEEDLEQLFRASAEIKYGELEPTPWSVRENLQRGRAVLDALPEVGLASLLFQGDVRSTAEVGLQLFGDYSLADPVFLALIPIGLIAIVYGRSRRSRPAARVSCLPGGPVPRTLAQRLGWFPTALQASALILVSISLARPLRGNVEYSSVSEGIDIALVVDRSSSMQFNDLDRAKNRLEVVKEVVGDFAERRMTDTVGASDNVALFSFAQYPELLCPFTLDVSAMKGFLKQLELVKYEAEDGTGIGRALAKAVAVLRESDSTSKIVVLLTDGENNIDDIPPLRAAELAAEEDVRVYTVLAGRHVFARDFFGRYYPTEQRVDSSELEAIAEVTGGRFFAARDRETLEAVYAEIESLERTPREDKRFTETFDLYPAWLLCALVVYAAAWLSCSTWARRLP